MCSSSNQPSSFHPLDRDTKSVLSLRFDDCRVAVDRMELNSRLKKKKRKKRKRMLGASRSRWVERSGSGEPEIGGQPERRFPGSVGSVVSSGMVLVVITYGKG